MRSHSLATRIFCGLLITSTFTVTSCSHRLERNPAGEAPMLEPGVEDQALPQAETVSTPLPLDLVGALQDFSREIQGGDGRSGLMKTAGDSIVAHSKKKGTRKYLTDGDVQQLLGKGRELRARVLATLRDAKYSNDAKYVLIHGYVMNVLLPVRRLAALLWTDADTQVGRKNPAQDLLIRVSRAVVPKGSKLEASLSVSPLEEKASGVHVRDIGSSTEAELALDPLAGLQFDVEALSFAQTKENYVRALKLLMLQMILTQQQFYKALSGSEMSIDIPQKCRDQMSAGLPDTIEVPELTELERRAVVDSVLIGNGVVGNTSQWREHFIDNVKADPTTGGFPGYLPFERYRAARYGLDPKRPREMEPNIDDTTDFQAVVGVKSSRVIDKTANREVMVYGKKIGSHSLVGQILSLEEENWIRMVEGEPAPVHTAGLSTFLVNQMKARDVTNWIEVVPENLQQRLAANVVPIDMPSLDGSDAWSRWGLYELARTMRAFHTTGNQDIQALFKNSCPTGKKETKCYGLGGCVEIVEYEEPRACMGRVWKLLEPFATDGEETLLPRVAYETPELRSMYPSLRRLWTGLRDQRALPAAKMKEWDYIVATMDQNPWASARISYLLASENLRHIGGSGRGGYPNVFRGLADELKLNEPLRPFHGNRVLSDKEKKSVWQYIVSDEDEQNSQIFGSKTFAGDDAPDAYSMIYDLTKQTILDLPTAQKYQTDVMGFVKTEAANERWAEVWNEPQAQASQIMLGIYRARGDIDKQKSLYDEYINKFGVDADDDGNKDEVTPLDVKEAFLDLDNGMKAPLYDQILTRAAVSRRTALAQPLNDLCNRTVDGDLNSYKDLYYRTIKMQDQVNRAFGIQGVPKEVMKEAERWSKQDWNNLYLGLLQGLLWIGVTMTAAGCTALTAGLCLPVALTLAVAATGLSVYMVDQVTDMVVVDRERQSALRIFHQLGLSDDNSLSRIREHHEWEIALEVAFAFPLIGGVAKTVHIGAKAGKLGLRRFAARAFGRATDHIPEIRMAVREVEASTSRYALQMLSKREAASYMAHYARMFLLDPFTRKGWSRLMRNAFRVEIVRESPAEINRAFARSLADYFGNNPDTMLKFFRSYTRSKLARWERKAAKLGDKLFEDTANLTGMQRLWRNTVTTWRHKRLTGRVDNLKKLKAMETEVAALRAAGRPLDDFIEKNADEFGEMLFDLPMRKRELPYFMLGAGAPGMSPRAGGGGAYVRYFGRTLAGSLAVKRIAMARDTLLSSSIVNEALSRIGVKEALALNSSYDAFQSFRHIVTNLPDEKAIPELNKLMEALAERMAKHQVEKLGGSITPEAIVRIFNSTDVADQEAARILWEQTPLKELFSVPGFEGQANKALKQYANYTDLDEFQNYVNALNISMISRKQIQPTVSPIN